MIFKNKGRILVVYKSVWGDKEFKNVSIAPNSEKSPSSYKFVGESEDVCKIIKSVYEIENEELFNRQYSKAVSGNGNESDKILTLHSSSRLALLTFYNIDADNTLILNINGKPVEFDFSTFEFKNPVIGYPSNMDIVLVSKDRKIVLFLESKFSEYYMSAGNKSAAISTQYASNKYSQYFYDKEWLKTIGIGTSYNPECNTQKKFFLSMKDEKVNYLDGFKQMISHYIGIRRRIEEKKRITSDTSSDENKRISDTILSVLWDSESVIYLGEILFDRIFLPERCEGELDPQAILKDYGKLYSSLAAKMNEIIAIDKLAHKFIVLSEELKYSDILQQVKIEPIIKDFYS